MVPPTINAAAIPAPLCERVRWVCWRYVTRAGEAKPTKVPINARTGAPASSTDPATWSAFAVAVEASARYDGLGYVFAAEDGVVGVDLDGCRDPATGAIDKWALDVLGGNRLVYRSEPERDGVARAALGRAPAGWAQTRAD